MVLAARRGTRIGWGRLPGNLSWEPQKGTRAAALLWGGWLVVTAAVFSYMSGIIHPYSTVALAPAIAALAGSGATALWQIRHTWAARITLAGALLVTVAWAWVLLGRSASWFPWLRVVIAIAAAGAAAMILAVQAARAATSRGRAALAIAPLSLALIAGLGGPLAYSIDTAATAHTGSIPTAGPGVAGSSGGPGGAQPATGTLPGSLTGARTGKSGKSGTAGTPDPARRRVAPGGAVGSGAAAQAARAGQAA